ncbi:MAG: PEP-CTERM sorting domain-containing protein [Verrucomicrobiota bacterium]
MNFRLNRALPAAATAVLALTGATAWGAFQVQENYSVNQTWTPGFVQSSAPNMPPQFIQGSEIGTEQSLVQTFTPETDYNFVSVEFRYEILAPPSFGNSFLIFNLYALSEGPTAPTIDVGPGGSGLLNSGGGFSYNPTSSTLNTLTNMVFALEGGGIPLQAGVTYAFEVFADEVDFAMLNIDSTPGIGGQAYRNYEAIDGIDLLLAIYDTNILENNDPDPPGPIIPEPASGALLLGALGLLAFRRCLR